MTPKEELDTLLKQAEQLNRDQTTVSNNLIAAFQTFQTACRSMDAKWADEARFNVLAHYEKYLDNTQLYSVLTKKANDAIQRAQRYLDPGESEPAS